MTPLCTLVIIMVSASVFACGDTQGPMGEETPTTHAEAVPVVEHASTAFRSCAAYTGPDASLARDVEPIFMSRCSGEFCHGLSMTTPARTYAFLVGQYSLECDDPRALVTPGDLEHSYLVDKILGRNLCGGHPMPRGLGNRLSPQQIRAVTDWICEGARND